MFSIRLQLIETRGNHGEGFTEMVHEDREVEYPIEEAAYAAYKQMHSVIQPLTDSTMVIELLMTDQPVERAEFKEGETAELVAWMQEKGHAWDANTGHLPNFRYTMHVNDMMNYVNYWVDKLDLQPAPVGCGLCKTKDGKHSFPCSCACHN